MVIQSDFTTGRQARRKTAAKEAKLTRASTRTFELADHACKARNEP